MPLALRTKLANPLENEVVRRADIFIPHALPRPLGTKVISAVSAHEHVVELRALTDELTFILGNTAKANAAKLNSVCCI